jgi:anti-anti-sigma factor
MSRQFRQIEVEQQGDVFCVSLRNSRLSEEDIYAFSEDILELINEDGCRKLVLDLGPKDPFCMFSVFLAKLVSINRRLEKNGGRLKLACVGPQTFHVFEVCNLHNLFDFAPDRQTAVASFT